MVNYENNELNSNNGGKVDVLEKIHYDSKMEEPVDLASDTLDIKRAIVIISSEYHLDGVLINGSLCGPGKIYYTPTGKVAYEGMLIGKYLYGPGKEYYYNGNVRYEGTFVRSKYSGHGKLKDPEGNLLYEGGFLDNERNGEGEEYYENGKTKYRGGYANGEYNGKGTLYYKNGEIEYEGGFANGKFNIAGRLNYENGNTKYFGGFANNKYNGKGELYYENKNLQYDGHFVDDKYNGYGRLNYEDGQLKYKGYFSDNKFNGEGKLYSSKVFYKGGPIWYKEEVLIHNNEPIWYKGEFLNGRIHGEGEFLDHEGNLYKGYFIKDHMVESGKMITREGDLRNGRFNTGSIINNILNPVVESSSRTPQLNGYSTIYFNGNIAGPYATSYYDKGEIVGKTYFYDRKCRLVLAAEVDELDCKVLHGNGIEYRYNEYYSGSNEFWRESREFKAEKGKIKYIATKECDFGFWDTKYSVYWDGINNPLNIGKPMYINPDDSYELMIDALKNKAHSEVDIMSPWISYWVNNREGKELLNALESALKRGVTVKIVTGYGKDEDNNSNNDNNSNKDTKNTRYQTTEDNVEILRKKFKAYEENLKFHIDNNHEKMLLCDNDFMIYGSYNMLSRELKKTKWKDSMRVSTNPKEIRERRKELFNF